MKNVIPFTTVLFLIVQSFVYGQLENADTSSNKQDVVLEKQIQDSEIDTARLNDFVGTYFLAEAEFNLEILKEDDGMFIVSPFSKDILILKNETTLHELTRGVDLELIEGDKDALKFTQNGYETIIRRVNSTKVKKVK